MKKVVITKTIQKNGATDTSATGTFYYAVYTEEYDPAADPAQTPVRRGSITVTANGTASATEQDLYYGTYYVYELTAEGGTPIISGDGGSPQVFGDAVYVVTGSGTQSVINSSAAAAMVLVNTIQTTEINVKKVDAADVNKDTADSLKGAGFRITRYTDNTFRSIDGSWGENGSKELIDVNNNGTYSLNGLFEFDGLLPGYYMLEETQYPDGYIKMDKNPTFQVKVKDNSTDYEIIQLVKGEGDEYIPGTTDLVRIENNTTNIIVGNTPGTALPNTGGPGTNMLYLLGIVLTGIAGAGLVMRKRRKAA